MKNLTYLTLIFLLSTLIEYSAYAQIEIVNIEPTPFFPKIKEGEELRQLTRITLNNTGSPAKFDVQITVRGKKTITESLGVLGSGEFVKNIYIPDIKTPTKVTLKVLSSDNQSVITSYIAIWRPAKKWSIYAISYSHHDLGYGGYPHRLRTEIRLANIDRALEFCKLTDDWDDDSKFRFVIETAEPITSFINSIDETKIEELSRRIREGRIQIGAMHSTVSTEMMGHEIMARLFYLSGRHVPDLFNVKKSRTALNDDVIGMTWPLVDFMNAAELPYFFHGHNLCGECMMPAQNEPIFYWEGPDKYSKVLTRSTSYTNDKLKATKDWVRATIEKYGKGMPVPVIMVQDASDFKVINMNFSNQIHDWNTKYDYPRIISSTMDMYFDAVTKLVKPGQIKSFKGDSNNQWADQDASDAWLLGIARRLDEEIPSIEKFTTISQALFNGGSFWTDIYQAYHRLLTYHEHTNARTHSGLIPEADVMKHYETELEENREMVTEVQNIVERLKHNTLNNIAKQISTDANKSIVIFNPLSNRRTEITKIEAEKLPIGYCLRDAITGELLTIQRLDDGSSIFIAKDIPPMGYRTYYIVATAKSQEKYKYSGKNTLMESDFYRINFNKITGNIISIYDKKLNVELVDPNSPHQFNEYLYEQYQDDEGLISKWHKVEKADSLIFTKGLVADIMTVYAKAKGVEKMKQTITLYHNVRQIDFALDIIKSPSGRDVYTKWDIRSSNKNKEAIYVALPFAIPDYRFHHESPGAVIEPIQDMFNGAGTAHYGIRHFTDVSNKDYGVTVSARESGLVEYGYPRSEPIAKIKNKGEEAFEKKMVYPKNSGIYLYLVNNMFSTNIRLDQQGPLHFTWSIRSHQGGWKEGKANEFGWNMMNPFWLTSVNGKKQGKLPLSKSFVSVDKPNVECLTLKPADFNGKGFILRFHETLGQETAVNVNLPFLGKIARAIETSLLEEDKPTKVKISNGSNLSFNIRPFEIKTIRVVYNDNIILKENIKLKASAISDMEIKLSWEVNNSDVENLSHYRVYRSTKPEFEPSLLKLVQRPIKNNVVDKPHLYYGGWINNRLEPNTVYYYRVAAVDRWNNQGELSKVVKVKTLDSDVKNMLPLKVEALRAIYVSPIAPFNFVNLLWRTSCESDIERYEVHRSTQSDFTPDSSTIIGKVEANAILKKGNDGHGQTAVNYRNNEYDHMMFEDKMVEQDKTYYYKVRAIDNAGAKGEFSSEVSVSIGHKF